MNWADWVIIAIVLLSCLFGMTRGFVRESLSLIIWIIAALCARIFVDSADSFLSSIIETSSIRAICAFLLIFILILLAGAVIQHLAGKLIHVSGLSVFDRALGVAFGALRGLIIVMVLLLVLPKLAQVKQNTWWKESYLIPFFLQWNDLTVLIYSQVSDWLIQLFDIQKSHSI